jgi:uncharacterized protein (TIGR03663 family)
VLTTHLYTSIKKHHRREDWLCLLIILAAMLIRVLYLTDKPPHFDEGVNGWFVDRMWTKGFYQYNPNNYHGPAFFYILQLSEMVFGRGILALRSVAVLFSLSSVGLILLHRKFVGRAAIWAGLLAAISPGFVFYGRYAIHEGMFVCCLLLLSLGLFYSFNGKVQLGWKVIVAAIAGLLLTKETHVFHMVIFAIALGLLYLYHAKNQMQQNAPLDPVWRNIKTTHGINTALIGVFVVALVYSGFFLDPRGLAGFGLSLFPWLKTGFSGAGHEKSFFYWLRLLTLYEWAILVSWIVSWLIVASAAASVLVKKTKRVGIWLWLEQLTMGKAWLIFFALVGLGGWAMYSIVPYKTPWLILSWFWPFFFVFGHIVESLFAYRRILGGLALALVVAATLSRSVDLNFYKYADKKEPYVYVQTTTDYWLMQDVIDKAIADRPELINMKMRVLIGSTWPLPWVWGRYPNVSYERTKIKEPFKFEVIIAERKDRSYLFPMLKENYFHRQIELRDAQAPISVFFKKTTFAEHTGAR